MNQLIQAYFEKLGLGQDKAKELHRQYYKQYSLSIRGLVLHHDSTILTKNACVSLKSPKVDPKDYDRACDQAIPLEQLLAPDPRVRELLSSIDRRRFRLLALTNAYRTVGALPCVVGKLITV
jgi:pyrimidine and pyridine-specific 5'-nucleotidase